MGLTRDAWVGEDVGYGYMKLVNVDDLGTIRAIPSISGSLSSHAERVTEALAHTQWTQWEVDGMARLVGQDVYDAGCRTQYKAFDANRVANPNYIYLALLGIAMMLPRLPSEQSVNVVTGLPNQFFATDREGLAAALRGVHVVREKRGERVLERRFRVVGVKVLPQSVGGLHDAYLQGDGAIADAELAEMYIGGCDIGMRTIDLAAMLPGWRLDAEALRPSGDNLGMTTVVRLCESYLAQAHGVVFGTHELDMIIRQQRIRFHGQDIDLTSQIGEWKRQAASQIWEYIAGQWDRLTRLDRIYFMGGGAAALWRALRATAPKGITQDIRLLPDAETAIVRGFGKAAEQLRRAEVRLA